MTTKSEIRIFEKDIKPQKFEKNTHDATFSFSFLDISNPIFRKGMW